MGTIIIRGLQTLAVALAALFSVSLVRNAKANKERVSKTNPILIFFVQGITMFFDTLGIGAYAPQTAIWKLFKMVPDKLIPGTLNVCSLIPQCCEALIFIAIVKVDPVTLLTLVLCCAVGSNIGARIVGKLPEKTMVCSSLPVSWCCARSVYGPPVEKPLVLPGLNWLFPQCFSSCWVSARPVVSVLMRL